MSEKTTIGTSVVRLDAWEKVLGRADYVADIHAEDVKTALVLRSAHHHAEISSIETGDAQSVPGVLSILTASDVTGELVYGEIIPDRPVLAREKVRFIGEPIAIVIAENRSVAEEARDKIRVVYKPLPPVFNPEEALNEKAEKIHNPSNLCSSVNIDYGDIQQGFEQADIIIEDTFVVPRIYPGYLEPEANLAVWDNEALTVWVSSQKPFHDRAAISHVLAIPEEKIIVKSAAIGGAFGGKEDASLAILTALAAYSIQGTVTIVNTREESILAHPKRHPAILHYRIGAMKDGTLTAFQSRVYLDTGAYASYGPAVAQLHTETVTGPYRIPNVKAETYLCYTNSPVSGAMRGFGSPQANFACERMMDKLADKLDLDKGALRRKNIWQPGDQSFTRVKINQAESIALCLDLAMKEKERLGGLAPGKGKRSGVGFALAVQTMGLGRGVPDDSTNRMEWLPNGDVLLRVGAPDLGQGLFTVAAQMTAEALGIDYDHVSVSNIDTSLSPDGGVTCASRMTYMVGNSLIQAARVAIKSLLEEAAKLFGVETDQLEYRQGAIYRLDKPGLPAVPASEITSRLAEKDEKIEITSTFSFPYGPETPDHLPIGMPHVLFCFGAQVARVEVDTSTGEVEVKDIVAIHDVGKAINRAAVEGQIEGGVATGIGYTLYESVKLKQDSRWVDNFTEYLLPTTMDVPPVIKSIILELEEETGPNGVKGIGEISLVPTAAAICNAVFEATGVEIDSLPIDREKLIS